MDFLEVFTSSVLGQSIHTMDTRLAKYQGLTIFEEKSKCRGSKESFTSWEVNFLSFDRFPK